MNPSRERAVHAAALAAQAQHAAAQSRRPEPLDLTPCEGCGFSKSGITAGCAHCARRHPERYAAWAQEMSKELDELRAKVRAANNGKAEP